ncbi:MAG TPA: hypothetical protein VL523_10145 [Terriglobia bacterium]|nr:hypothetical protein [Terriglobia bacterium]
MKEKCGDETVRDLGSERRAGLKPVRGVYKGNAGQRLSVDVRVRPALDDDGRERLQRKSPTSPEQSPLERPQQPAQQQQ